MTSRALAGKTALVTGAGRGIGRATALAFAGAGASVGILSRTREELESAAAQARALGARIFCETCDVSRPDEARAFVRGAVASLGAIDILVNCAGLASPRMPMAEVTDADWEAVLGANLSGVFYMTRETLRQSMLSRGAGCVINLTSRLGREARPNWGPYGPSKFGLEGLTQAWAQETRDTGVRFYSINPGPTRTDMRAASHPKEDPAKLKPPEAAAAALLELVSGRRLPPTGAALELDVETGALLKG